MMYLSKFRAIYSLSILSASAFFWSKAVPSNDSENEEDGASEGTPRIAIIGGGVGGTSCAYFLRELFGDTAEIDLYEKGDISGRIKNIEILGRKYESGASIIHPRNKYLVHYAEKFGLKHKDKPEGLLTGAYDGEKFVFEESRWGLVTILKMLWQYGLWDLWGLRQEVNGMLNKFDNIYDLQERGQAFVTVKEMLYMMGGDEFVRQTMLPADQMLREKKFSEKFISEVVSMATRVNYGQDTDMEGFAAAVSLAGVQPGLWAVEGGNPLLPENFNLRSRATVRKRRVTEVTLKPTSKSKPSFSVTHVLANDPETKYYDMVVIATPLDQHISDIEFVGFPTPIGPFPGKYRTTVATFVNGTLNEEAFGKHKGERLPDAIITTRDNSFGIRSVARNYPVDFKKDVDDHKSSVYKIFSTALLSDEQIGKLFSSWSSVDRQVWWQAYPYYQNVDIDKVATFELHQGMFYVSPIEWAASAIEMSVIGAKNVALLAKEHWGEAEGEKNGPEVIKEEL